MAKKIKDKDRDGIDFGTTKIDTLFNSIFYPTLLSMVFASLFTVADGIYCDADVHFPARHVARCSCDRVHDAGRDPVDK